MAATKKNTTRTDKEKLAILAYAKEHGQPAASKKFKCSSGSMWLWKKKLVDKEEFVTKTKRQSKPGTALAVQPPENTALIERIQKLEEENTFLRKAVAYFSNEATQR